MPTEFKFDDLDLREQPARGEPADVGPSYQNTCQSTYCTLTNACTDVCCTTN